MGTQEVKLERAGDKSSDPICSFIHLGPRIFRVHDSDKLQTNALTRHYVNRRELESDQSIHVPLLRVLSFPPSDGLSVLLP